LIDVDSLIDYNHFLLIFIMI